MRTLVVEDDAKLGPLLRRALSGRAGACDLVGTGEDAIWMAKARTDAVEDRVQGLDAARTTTSPSPSRSQS
jgi:ActR/RegA family two-component response regulator